MFNKYRKNRILVLISMYDANIVFLYRQPDLVGQNGPNRPSVMQYPTPQPGVSQMFEELGNFIRKPPSQSEYVDGASTKQGADEVELDTKCNLASRETYTIGSPIKRTLFSAHIKF